MTRSIVGLSLLLAGFPALTLAQSCPATQYSMCLNGSCFCLPEFSGNLETMAEQARQMFEQAKAPVLEAWLRASRNDSFPGSRPIPPEMREALEGFVPPEALNRARYRVSENDGESINLGEVAMVYGGMYDGRTVNAITLVDIVVFRTEEDALGNAALWAHELTHVKQFLDWGVREFAMRYLSDPDSVEAAGYQAADDYGKWREEREKSQGDWEAL